MSAVIDNHAPAHGHDSHDHGDHHGAPHGLMRWVTTTNHKDIGTMYLWFSFIMFLVGGVMALTIRAELFEPGLQIVSPEFFNTMTTYHGLIMVFGAIMPAFVGFANWLIPLMIGAPDMAFPRMNNWSFWLLPPAGILLMSSFLLPGGAAGVGWTMYAPLTSQMGPGMDTTIFAVHLLGMSSIMGSINIITTILNMRAPGMTMMKMPMFVWTWLITAYLLIAVMPVLAGAVTMTLTDRHFGTSFFNAAGGGDPVLYQHIFWFFGHPEVYIIAIPAFGVVSQVIPAFSRKPLFGYASMVYATSSIAILSFIVWAHHMYLTGMGTKISTFFQATTMIISIPSVIILTCFFISLWGGSIRFNTPMLFALAFLPMFGIGGLTGLPLGFNVSDVHLHDTYYIIAHFHYVVAPGTIFALFAGVYYWYPKMTGRMMNEFWGRVHFWGSFVFMNVVFLPMFFQGMAGMLRRMSDGGANYSAAVNSKAGADVVGGLSDNILSLHTGILWGAMCLGLAQIPFIINVFWSIKHGEKVKNDNPWDATTLEWQTPTPPPHGNFTHEPQVHRGPYEYSVPGHAVDFIPQNEPAGPADKPLPATAH